MTIRGFWCRFLLMDWRRGEGIAAMEHISCNFLSSILVLALGDLQPAPSNQVLNNPQKRSTSAKELVMLKTSSQLDVNS